MGVIYLLIYVFGSVIVSTGSWRVFTAVLEGDPIMAGLRILGFGTLMIVMAAVLHAVVLLRHEDGGLREGRNPVGPRWLVLGLMGWWGPTLAAWIQFECFLDPIRMFPLVTLGGACAVALWGVFRGLPGRTYQGPVGMVAMSLVGIPMGLMTLSVPVKHFTYHLSAVDIGSYSTGALYGERSRAILNADDVTYLETSAPIFGEESQPFLEVLASARTINVAEEIAAGRMRELEDGTWIKIHDDGREEVLEELENFGERLDVALAADAATAAEAAARERAAWEAYVEERRQGGRIFGFGRAWIRRSADAS
ncbi:hypothetical protein DL240_18660 [Lujinxingia litoralis]|uniref:Uncharacterized protein n=1 Tax=Lujinxingia litoralis TaxID=2211119 RepID=A0A328C4A0_9DELT|nr:hypothetical protein [Lujinxingia litoralis]RAL20132.1 hypothetical protein DL240_18660 [Lujinxingia litoralis]